MTNNTFTRTVATVSSSLKDAFQSVLSDAAFLACPLPAALALGYVVFEFMHGLTDNTPFSFIAGFSAGMALEAIGYNAAHLHAKFRAEGKHGRANVAAFVLAFYLVGGVRVIWSDGQIPVNVRWLLSFFIGLSTLAYVLIGLEYQAKEEEMRRQADIQQKRDQVKEEREREREELEYQRQQNELKEEREHKHQVQLLKAQTKAKLAEIEAKKAADIASIVSIQPGQMSASVPDNDRTMTGQNGHKPRTWRTLTDKDLDIIGQYPVSVLVSDYYPCPPGKSMDSHKRTIRRWKRKVLNGQQ